MIPDSTAPDPSVRVHMDKPPPAQLAEFSPTRQDPA